MARKTVQKDSPILGVATDLENTPPFVSNRRFLKLRSCSVNLDDFKRLFKLLKDKANEAGDLEMNSLTKAPNATNEEFQNQKQLVREVCRLGVQINGVKGEQIIGHTETMFEPLNLPEQIDSIIFDSARYYRFAFDSVPKNSFEIRFDFSKPPLLDLSNPSIEPTPNNSYLQVVGNNETWVSGVYEKLQAFAFSKKLKRDWLHTHYIYETVS